MEKSSTDNPVVLVTGGSGFLGKTIVQELLDATSPVKPSEIRVLDIKPYDGAQQNRVHSIVGDIRNQALVTEACKGVNLVIHTAAVIDWGTKPVSEVLAINVGGTKNVVKACQENGVQALVFTSSLDAIYTAKPLVDIDESQPYPEVHQTAYCESKCLGEKVVVAANSTNLKTCVLRPSDVYGEADPYHIDPLIDMAVSGFYIRLGNGKSKCQHVYVGNMAYAHILAGNALLQGNEKVMGNVYFITDGPGGNFFTFFDKVVLGAGYKIWPKNLWLPKPLAYPMAAITEFGATLIKPIKKLDVKFSRFAVNYTCNDFTFSSLKAKTDFNFVPKYATEEALERTIAYYKKRNTKG